MKISTKGRYALRMLLDLAEHQNDGYIALKDIAARQNISVSYLEQIMALLKKAKIVTSSRGACGGYRLARPSGEISVGEVLRVLEGGLEAAVCPGNESENSCQGQELCVARYVWKRINDSITEAVDTMMLSELLEESRRIKKDL